MHIFPNTALHPLPDGYVQLLGAIDSVTGSCTRVETGGAVVIVDCGIAQGHLADEWKLPDGVVGADALLLTHGHLDHVGGLPAAFDAGFSGAIFATSATLAPSPSKGLLFGALVAEPTPSVTASVAVRPKCSR